MYMLTLLAKLLQLDLKHIHKVNFYPRNNNFTQALLVMLVTNIISGRLASKTLPHSVPGCNASISCTWAP